MYLTAKDTPFELDATGAQNTPELSIGENLIATVQAKAAGSVSWSNAVLSARVSLNGVDFYDLPDAVTISADGITDIIDVSGYAYIRVEVTTTDGSAPTIEVWIKMR